MCCFINPLLQSGVIVISSFRWSSWNASDRDVVKRNLCRGDNHATSWTVSFLIRSRFLSKFNQNACNLKTNINISIPPHHLYTLAVPETSKSWRLHEKQTPLGLGASFTQGLPSLLLIYLCTMFKLLPSSSSLEDLPAPVECLNSLGGYNSYILLCTFGAQLGNIFKVFVTYIQRDKLLFYNDDPQRPHLFIWGRAIVFHWIACLLIWTVGAHRW